MKKIVFLLSAILLLIGCGGGTSRSLPTTPKKSQMASLEKIDSAKAAKSSFDAIKIEDSATSFPTFKVVTPSKKFLNRVSSFFNRNFRLVDKSYLCESGNAKVDYVSNSYVIVYFDDCYSDRVTYDGQAEVIKESDNSKKVTFRNFSIETDNGYELEIEYSLWHLINSSNIKIEKLYATALWQGKVYKYLNFSMHIISDDFTTSSFNGYIYTDCLKGYVTLSSSGLTYSEEDISGQMNIKSKGKKVTIEFAKDDENSPTYVYITDTNGVVDSLTLEKFKQIKCN